MTDYRGTIVMLLLAACLSLLLSCAKRDNTPAVPERQGWVSDYAGILKPGEIKSISTELASYEKETCHQVLVLIIPSLDGESIADLSQRTANAWAIGQPGFGNGLLVTIAMKEGSVRMEAGSAFEWFIQDGTADRILKEVMFPLFKQDKFVDGLEQGLAQIMAAGRLKKIPDDHKPEICRQ